MVMRGAGVYISWRLSLRDLAYRFDVECGTDVLELEPSRQSGSGLQQRLWLLLVTRLPVDEEEGLFEVTFRMEPGVGWVPRDPNQSLATAYGLVLQRRSDKHFSCIAIAENGS